MRHRYAEREDVRRQLRTVRNTVRLTMSEPMTLIDRARTAVELQRLRRQRWSASDHRVDPRWYEALHALLGVDVPCDAAAEFADVWGTVKRTLTRDGERIAEKFDADGNLSRGIWCAVRHMRPTCVVETGVARGAISWIVLEALARNGRGHLWSVDLPNLAWAFDAGHAIPGRLRSRWTYLRGASARLLPRLIAEVGGIDIFVHDSLHTERNVRFELETVWSALADDGLVVVDDIDDITAYGGGRAFTSFVRSGTGAHWFVGRQEHKAGCFGVIAKREIVTAPQ